MMLYLDGLPVALKRGWNSWGNLGARYIPGVGIRFEAAKGLWRTIAVVWDSGRIWNGKGYMPPRGILTVRPDSPLPTLGLLRPYGEDWYIDTGGANWIDPCGEGSLLDHDAIMQRSPVSLTDMATGEQRNPATVPVRGNYDLGRYSKPWTTLPEYSGLLDEQTAGPLDEPMLLTTEEGAIRLAVLKLFAANGQHLIRSYRAAILHRGDPFVELDLLALAADASLAWSVGRARGILAGPAGHGHGNVGREWGWCAYLASIVQADWSWLWFWTWRSSFLRRMRAIAKHVQQPNGLVQRIKFGTSGPNPSPWGTGPGHCDVPDGLDVAQDIEGCPEMCALYHMGMHAEAALLARTMFTRPQAKWIDCDSGIGMGTCGADAFHPWPALGLWHRLDPVAARAAMGRWNVPKPEYMGGTAGPYARDETLIAALKAWGNPGMSRWALEALGSAP